jgi:hypothetical protein
MTLSTTHFSPQNTKTQKTKFQTSPEMTAHLFRLKIGANFFKNGNRTFDNWKVLSEICKNFFFALRRKGGGGGQT